VSSQEAGSITLWIGDLKAGEGEAAQKLWQRYFETIVRLARARLRGTSRAVADEEDIALSAFDSFFAAATLGRFPRLDDREDLWRLLVTITARKVQDQVHWQRRLKRGGGKLIDQAALNGSGSDGMALEHFACPEPTPEFAAQIAEECRHRLANLPDAMSRQVVSLRMEGYTNEEIAERLGCNRRTVVRKLELIRRRWQGEYAP
jgi:DNA-directed RNA polymerase specialized sigma24 family protein